MGYIRSDEHAFVRRDIENKILFPGEVREMSAFCFSPLHPFGKKFVQLRVRVYVFDRHASGFSGELPVIGVQFLFLFRFFGEGVLPKQRDPFVSKERQRAGRQSV